MTDINSDPMPSDRQTKLSSNILPDRPDQNNYERIVARMEHMSHQLGEQTNELMWLRHEWEDNKRDLFDLNELVGRLATQIEKWVGVAEELDRG